MSSMPPGPVAGKQVVLTGGTSGIGLAAAEALAARGANIAIVARDKQRGETAAARARAAAAVAGTKGTETAATPPTPATGPDHEPTVDVLVADLSSQADVRRLAAEIEGRYPRVDILVNNAGAVFNTRQVTADGIEQTWALNHLAPFLLTTLLLDRSSQSAPSRVITTASDAGKNSHIPFDDMDGTAAYSQRGLGKGFRRYGETKLANIVFTMELARRYAVRGLTAVCFHPGTVATNFNRNNGPLMKLGMVAVKPFFRSAEKGAETLVWLAEAPATALRSGGYFFDKADHELPAGAQGTDVGPRLWEVSERQVGAS